MATYKPVLHHRKKPDGTRLIMIRITKDRRVSYISSGHYVKEKDWNPLKSEVRATNDMCEIYNSNIKTIIRNAEIVESKALHSSLEIDSRTIKNKVKKTPGKDSFKQLATDYINSNKHKIASRSSIRYQTHLNAFIKIVGDITPDQITKEVIIEYEAKALIGKSQNTIHRGMKTLVGIYTALQEQGSAPAGNNPFRYSSVKLRKGTKERLTVEEILAISKASGTPGVELAKDVFLLQYYLGGLRISDVLILKKKNIQNDRIEYSDMKTDRQQSHLIIPKAKKIIAKYIAKKQPNDYVIPLISLPEDSPEYLKEIERKTSLVNKNLKALAKIAGITKTLTSHVARHTFADHLRQSSTDLYTISKALGHSSIKMTENYLETFDNKAVDNAMNQLFRK